ncbi:hypothetical protein N9S81_00440 [bacterium]|nr:hypothetical protein [bacterium]
MPKKSKTAPRDEPEEEVSSDEEIEELVDDDNDDNDDNDEEEEEQVRTKDKASLRNLRKKARNAGYRKLAQEVGAGVGNLSSNQDMIKYALSKSDIERLAKWCVETGEGVDDELELRERLGLKFSSLPEGALAVLHAQVEGFARNLMNDVVTRVFDGTSSTLTASNMRAALRKLKTVLDFNFDLPSGVVQHARTTEKGVFALDENGEKQWFSSGTILPELTEEEKVAVEENKVNVKALSKLIKGKDRAYQQKKEDAKKSREAKVASRRAADAPVSVSV